MKKQCSGDDDDDRVVYNAAKSGRVDQVLSALATHKHQLDAPVMTHKYKNSPMHIAAEKGHADVIETLLQAGSQAINAKNAHNFTPVMLAVLAERVLAVEMLVRHGAQIDGWGSYNTSIMQHAAQSGALEGIKMLVQFGSRLLDVPDKHGRTPMHYAARSDQAGSIATLLEVGCLTIDEPEDKFGWTPLHTAAKYGCTRAIEALVKAGSRALDAQDAQERTAMHLAASGGSGAAIDTLIRLGSQSVDAQTLYGDTPMHSAANSEAIEALVRGGSQTINWPMKWNCNTPLDLFMEIMNDSEDDDFDGCVTALLSLGAEVDRCRVEHKERAERLRTKWANPEIVAQVRFRVYFAHSLLHRLFHLLD